MTIEDIVEVIKDIEAHRREPSEIEKRLVHGQLLVNPKQYDALKRMGQEEPLPLTPSDEPMAPRAGSIPVVVIYPGRRPVDVGGGQVAFALADGTIYVMDRSKMDPPIIKGPLGIHRYEPEEEWP